MRRADNHNTTVNFEEFPPQIVCPVYPPDPGASAPFMDPTLLKRPARKQVCTICCVMMYYFHVSEGTFILLQFYFFISIWNSLCIYFIIQLSNFVTSFEYLLFDCTVINACLAKVSAMSYYEDHPSDGQDYNIWYHKRPGYRREKFEERYWSFHYWNIAPLSVLFLLFCVSFCSLPSLLPPSLFPSFPPSLPSSCSLSVA